MPRTQRAGHVTPGGQHHETSRRDRDNRGAARELLTLNLFLLACMVAVPLLVTCVPELYWWLPRSFGLVR
jgi:hypothetical protein